MKRLNLILWTFLMVSATVLTGCSSDDIATVISEPKTPVSADQWHVKILAGKGGQAFTRALAEGSDVDGEAGVIATWSNGDEISVWSGDTKIGTLTATPQDDAHQAVLEGTLSGNFKVGDELVLTYIMPDSKYRTYNGQDGTLGRLAQYYDYAVANVTVSQVTEAVEEGAEGTLSTGDATFNNMQAIVRLTCKQNGTPLNVAWLGISSASEMIGGADDGTLTVVSKTPSSRIFFAMTNQLSVPDIYYFYIKTSDGKYYYTKTATGEDGLPTASAMIEDGNFYPIELNNWTEYTPENPQETPTPPSDDPRITDPDGGSNGSSGGGTGIIPPPPPPTVVDKWWPLVTQDNHLVLFGKEAVAHGYGPVVGLLVAHDGNGGLVMSIKGSREQYAWGTQTEWCEGHIGGGNGLDMGNNYGTERTETQTYHAYSTYVTQGIAPWLWGEYVKDPPYNKKYYLNDWTKVQGDGETNTKNLVSCTDEYDEWSYGTIEADRGNASYLEYKGQERRGSHEHPAAVAAQNGGGVSAPSASGGWFLPSAQDWLRAERGIGYAGDHIYYEIGDYVITDAKDGTFYGNVNTCLSHATPYEYVPMDYYQYWTSTESAPGSARVAEPARWSNGYSGYLYSQPGFREIGKTTELPVRAFCKFKHTFSYSGDNMMYLYNKGANELDGI